MFGELSVMAWLGSAIILAIGGGAGFFVARQIKDKRTLELEQQLETAQHKLSEYQSDVNRHFLKTSLLFNKLTDNYREVYEHLATGAQKLCNQKSITTALDLPEAKILSAAANTTASIANTAEEKPAVDTDSSTPAEDQHDDSTHLGAESLVTENIVAAQAEAIATETVDQATQATIEQTTEAMPTEEVAVAASTEPANEEDTAPIETKSSDDRPTISAKELKALEAEEQKKTEEEDIHLGAESTPGVELEHHKTHPSIH